MLEMEPEDSIKRNLYLYAEFWKENVIVVGILVALVVITITTMLIYLRRRKSLQRGVLVFGLSESGKTVLFCKLVASKQMQTYCSMKENSAPVYLKNKAPLQLYDLPGNERLRMKMLDNFKHLARGVIFVIDSLNFPREVRDVAELLYTILSDRVINQNHIPFLVACNKQDETMAKGKKVIQSQLEKEINTLRVTKSAVLDATSDAANNNTFLGRKGKDFEFSDLKPISVEFVECSAWENDDTDNLKNITDWLAKIA